MFVVLNSIMNNCVSINSIHALKYSKYNVLNYRLDNIQCFEPRNNLDIFSIDRGVKGKYRGVEPKRIYWEFKIIYKLTTPFKNNKTLQNVTVVTFVLLCSFF